MLTTNPLPAFSSGRPCRFDALLERIKALPELTAIDINNPGKGTPVTSIFAESPMPEPDVDPEYRPATVPKKKSLVAIKPNQFISYQAIADFCEKVGEL